MLHHLHIENYALIKHSDIDFSDGFVAITGETGAGKSIMLGALSLLLGQRADVKVLHDPEHKCIVEAQFKVTSKRMKDLFDANDVDYNEDGTIIIRREILPSAKSRAFVNDTPVQVTFLRQLGARIIDIHSQHATLLLGESGYQTSLLDSLSNDKKALSEYKEAYQEYTTLKQKLEQLTIQDQQNRKDYDYNKFLFDELSAASLVSDEQGKLEQESSLLANAEEIKQSLSQVVNICDGDEDSALARLNAAKTSLGKIAPYDPQLDSLHERLESAIIELNDIVATLDSANQGISFSPLRQQEVDERLDLIYRLEKKHNVSDIESLIALQQHLDDLLNQACDNDREIQKTMEAVDKAYKILQRQASKLTSARKEAAKNLEKDIIPLLGDLGMGNATLKADIEPSANYSSSGGDNVKLLFNANKGGQLRELDKVASGGEMSRLMLAIKALTARSGLLPTVIFDEIDSGISGDISVKVGGIMQLMAESMQVIVITHLPQIAAHAKRHYKVYKDVSDETTASNIRLLTHDERRKEIATMLSSEPPSQAALKTAEELMKGAK
ncbi:MAG: DNA repair protein RecN [Bacteroidales bacterium]|nr:DNA repair protein RecN [Bacteroidales bacterium]